MPLVTDPKERFDGFDLKPFPLQPEAENTAYK